MTEEQRVYWVAANTYLNGVSIPDYNWKSEAQSWAKGEDYFPELSWEEFLEIARKYEVWTAFEEAVLK